MSCSYKEKVLSYLRGTQEDENEVFAIEKHIDNCVECQALIEGYTQKAQEVVNVPTKEFEGNDNELKKSVVNYEKGTKRILVFTIIGLILGWFSHFYYSDQFIVTKIILAIPYKANEMIHNILHSHRGVLEYYYWSNLNAFFPQSSLATFFAERITPVLIGGAIYGSLAYFTGNKTVFTLRKYIKFATIWCLIILTWVGGTFLVNSYTVHKNNELKNISGYLLYSENGSTGYYRDNTSNVIDMLDSAFYENDFPRLIKSIERDSNNEHDIGFSFGKLHLGHMRAKINPIERYLVTDENKIYEISESFAKLVLEYINTEEIKEGMVLNVEMGCVKGEKIIQ